jgi:hypothetical protein
MSKKLEKITTDCGAEAIVQVGGRTAIAQTEVPEKGSLCGKCVYRRKFLIFGEFSLISEDSNRHCWENRVPVRRRHRK